MNDFWNRPCAGRGLDSYRYRGRFGFIMIGAVSPGDAMQEAKRSTPAPARDRLERWNGAAYRAAFETESARPLAGE